MEEEELSITELDIPRLAAVQAMPTYSWRETVKEERIEVNGGETGKWVQVETLVGKYKQTNKWKKNTWLEELNWGLKSSTVIIVSSAMFYTQHHCAI